MLNVEQTNETVEKEDGQKTLKQFKEFCYEKIEYLMSNLMNKFTSTVFDDDLDDLQEFNGKLKKNLEKSKSEKSDLL